MFTPARVISSWRQAFVQEASGQPLSSLPRHTLATVLRRFIGPVAYERELCDVLCGAFATPSGGVNRTVSGDRSQVGCGGEWKGGTGCVETASCSWRGTGSATLTVLADSHRAPGECVIDDARHDYSEIS